MAFTRLFLFDKVTFDGHANVMERSCKSDILDTRTKL